MRRVHRSLLAVAVGAVALAAVLSGCADGGKPVTLASTVPSSPPAGVEAAGSTDTGRGTPTGTKRAESILWFNDGVWWANMWDVISNDFHIFRLDPTTRTWKDDRVLADGRADTHADVLWNGTKLFIASHQFPKDTQPAVAGDPSLLFRYSYDKAQPEVHGSTPAIPATINTTKSETLTIDQDSTGTLWATWQQGNTIYVNSTTSGTDQTQWGTPHPLPHARGVSVDDTSAVVVVRRRPRRASCGAASTARHRTACTSAATRTGRPTRPVVGAGRRDAGPAQLRRPHQPQGRQDPGRVTSTRR